MNYRELILKDNSSTGGRLLMTFEEKELDLDRIEITTKEPDKWSEFSGQKMLFFSSGNIFYKTMVPAKGNSTLLLRKSKSRNAFVHSY